MTLRCRPKCDCTFLTQEQVHVLLTNEQSCVQRPNDSDSFGAVDLFGAHFRGDQIYGPIATPGYWCNPQYRPLAYGVKTTRVKATPHYP